jgi:dTDP-4-amino-4,6-dideoxygalactose transaminase
VDKNKYGITRDELYFKLRAKNIWSRRYFYPLISTFTTYRGLKSAHPDNLPVATRMADEVICLPIHHELSEENVQRVIDVIINR